MKPRDFGKYVLLSHLGSGGSGDVFMAKHKASGSRCVVKCLRHRDDPTFSSRFLHECEIAARVQSAHVATVLDAGLVEGVLYFAMEFVDGPTLSKVLGGVHAKKARIPLGVVASMVLDGLSGLGAVHRVTGEDGQPLDVVHRDVAPKNLIAGFDGTVRLIDLGFGRSNAQPFDTRTDVVIGSLGYMSPEQATGGVLDQRSDLFAMGVVLFELLTINRFIEPGPIHETFEANQNPRFIAPSRLNPQVPEALDAVVERALMIDRKDRYANAEQFIDALQQALPRADSDQVSDFVAGLVHHEVPTATAKPAAAIHAASTVNERKPEIPSSTTGIAQLVGELDETEPEGAEATADVPDTIQMAPPRVLPPPMTPRPDRSWIVVGAALVVGLALGMVLMSLIRG